MWDHIPWVDTPVVTRRDDGSVQLGVEEGLVLSGLSLTEVQWLQARARDRQRGPIDHERARSLERVLGSTTASNDRPRCTDVLPQLAQAHVIVDGPESHTAYLRAQLQLLGIGSVSSGAYAAECGDLGLTDGQHPGVDVLIFMGLGPADPDRALPWQRAGVPHFGVDLRGTEASVGPLVIPGRSSCLRCHDLDRTDRDSSWPRIATTVRGLGRGPQGPTGGSPAVALLASAVAASLVVSVIEGEDRLAGISTEVCRGVPELIHRHWPRHPRCDCLPHPAGHLV